MPHTARTQKTRPTKTKKHALATLWPFACRAAIRLACGVVGGAWVARAAQHRVINHTSKRVLSNTVAMCNLLTNALDQLGLPDDDDEDHLAAGGRHGRRGVSLRREVRQLLATTRAECTTGLNLCCSALLRARSISGQYTPVLETISLSQLFEGLGWSDNP